MKIIIAGAGEVGTHLAKLLSRENFDILLLDEDASKLRDLEASFDLLTSIGSPTSIKDLKEVSIEKADFFAYRPIGFFQINGSLLQCFFTIVINGHLRSYVSVFLLNGLQIGYQLHICFAKQSFALLHGTFHDAIIA